MFRVQLSNPIVITVAKHNNKRKHYYCKTHKTKNNNILKLSKQTWLRTHETLHGRAAMFGLACEFFPINNNNVNILLIYSILATFTVKMGDPQKQFPFAERIEMMFGRSTMVFMLAQLLWTAFHDY